MAFDMNTIAGILGISLPVLILIVVWTAIWKGIALWKAARKNHLVWFIVLLVVNTLGILEILYIFLFADLNKRIKEEGKQVRRRRRK